MLDINTLCYMFYHKMRISWPDYGSRPIGLLDKQIKTFAEQRVIQQNRGLSGTWPEAVACMYTIEILVP